MYNNVTSESKETIKLKSFGDMLRDFRLRRKLTQQELADRLGLSSPYIAQMESGFKPPPPQMLVEKIGGILQLSRDDLRIFTDSAEKERELQSLVKATRKSGYVLAGNKVCVPQKSVNYRLQNELDKVIKSIPRDVKFHIDLSRTGNRQRKPNRENQSITSHQELLTWALLQLSERPVDGLVFLGLLFDVLMLTPDERILCRQPSKNRVRLIETGRDVGEFFKILQGLILETQNKVEEQNLPDVIAPHEVWKNLDDVLGSDQPPKVENTTPQRTEQDTILNIPVMGVIEPGTDEFSMQRNLGFIGLPRNWFNEDLLYEACSVQTDAYISLGVWPGCKAIYEIGGDIDSEDLVVVELGENRCIRKYFEMDDHMFLQGGPLARPIRVKKSEPGVNIVGVIRELVSRFREIS